MGWIYRDKSKLRVVYFADNNKEYGVSLYKGNTRLGVELNTNDEGLHAAFSLFFTLGLESTNKYAMMFVLAAMACAFGGLAVVFSLWFIIPALVVALMAVVSNANSIVSRDTGLVWTESGLRAMLLHNDCGMASYYVSKGKAKFFTVEGWYAAFYFENFNFKSSELIKDEEDFSAPIAVPLNLKGDKVILNVNIRRSMVIVRKYFGFPTYHYRADATVGANPSSTLIPRVQGKGENSWDCDDECAFWDTSFPLEYEFPDDETLAEEMQKQIQHSVIRVMQKRGVAEPITYDKASGYKT